MITATDYLTLAESLVHGVSEAEWRSAVSRGYYAAFHTARDLMRDLRFRVPRADQAHAFLSMRLSNCGDARTQTAGADLQQLRSDRNHADYEFGRRLTQADALLLVQAARRIIQILDTARQEPTRTQITDAIKIYERDVLKSVTWQP